MEAIALKPRRAEMMFLVMGLTVLSVAMLLLPEASVLLAAAMPLLSCPLVGRKEEGVAWAAAVVPVIASLLGGMDRAYSLSLLALTLPTLIVTRYVPFGKRRAGKGMLWYISAVAAGFAAVLLCLTWRLGGPLWQTLTQEAVEGIEGSEQAGLLLYRMAASGLVSMPENMAGSDALLHVFEPLFIRQTLMSFRLTMEALLSETIPEMFVRGSLVVGLFTALRIERLNGSMLLLEKKTQTGERRTHVAVPPGFSLLTLPRKLRVPVAVMAVAGFVLMTGSTSFEWTLGLLMFTAFSTLLELVGAAVLIFVLSVHKPDRIRLYGALTVGIYLLAPTALFIIGVTDPMFHYRTKRVRKMDE